MNYLTRYRFSGWNSARSRSRCSSFDSFRLGGLTIYLYNNAVLGDLVKGAARIASAHRFVSAFWRIVTVLSSRVWYARVPSKFNCAGAPSRGHIDFAVRRASSCHSVTEWLELQRNCPDETNSLPIPGANSPIYSRSDIDME